MGCDLLFVYGTLRKGTSTDMYRMLAREAHFVSDAQFQGQLFRVDYYPGVIHSDNPRDIVYGELYQMINPDDLLAKLDAYEECGNAFPHPQEYIRSIVSVTTPDGVSKSAWSYIYNLSVVGLERIISGDFLDNAPKQGETAT